MNGIDILVLHYLNGKDETYELNQSFWTFSYSANIEKIVKKLINKNYINLDFDLEKSLSSCKVPELKEILKSNDLPVSGKKIDLIERIIESADKQKYQHLLKKVWVPSSEGKKIIHDTDFIMYAHRHLTQYVNINDVYNSYLSNTSESNKDILIASVNKTLKFNGKTSTYPVGISYALWDLSKVCRFYKDEYGQFNYLVKACVSSFVSRTEPELMDYMFSEFSYFYNEFKIPSVFIDDLKMVLSSNNEYSASLEQIVIATANQSKGVNYFSAAEILKIIYASLQMDDESIMSIYEKSYKRRGGKIRSTINPTLKEIATKEQKGTNLLSKIIKIFKN